MVKSLREFAKNYFVNNGFKLLVARKMVLCFGHTEKVDPGSFIAIFEDWAHKLFPNERFDIVINPLENRFCVFIIPMEKS